MLLNIDVYCLFPAGEECFIVDFALLENLVSLASGSVVLQCIQHHVL